MNPSNEVQAIWDQARRGGRMHHAWLLTGARGLGKAAFAERAARDLVGASATGPHPDILRIAPAPKDDKEARKAAEGKDFQRRRNITVQEVRTMTASLSTRPTLGDARAIVVDPADALERAAANALLKVLEEPPRGTVFLLIAHHAARLLPTIRSRCRLLLFKPVDAESMQRELVSAVPSASIEERKAAIDHAGGSPGAAKRFIEFELGPLAEAMAAIEQGNAPTQTLVAALGPRPGMDRLRAFLELARRRIASRVDQLAPDQADAVAGAYHAVAKLEREAFVLNFDPGLLAAEVGRLLAAMAEPRSLADG